MYYIKKHSYTYIQCAPERLYLNSKYWVDHYRDIHLYTYRPRGYYFTGAVVYVYDLMLGESLPPLKNDNFTKILDATTKEFEFCKF